jgi:hypothetical protein
VSAPNLQNLRGQTLLFRCLETGFVTNSPALTRYQQGRGIDPTNRELVGERPANWVREVPTSVCEHCGAVIKGNQWVRVVIGSGRQLSVFPQQFHAKSA